MLSFSLEIEAVEEACKVIFIKGDEKLTCDYEFEVEVQVNKGFVFDKKLIFNNAVIKFFSNEEQHEVGGIIISIDQIFSLSQNHDFYSIKIGSLLTPHKHNELSHIFIDQPVTEVIEEVLFSDYNIKFVASTTANYPSKHFTHRYKESSFNFFTRLCEHWGIYYYFDRLNEDTLVIADDLNYLKLPKKYQFLEHPTPSQQPYAITSLRQQHGSCPTAVKIQGRNPEFSSQKIESIAGEEGLNSTVKLSGLGIDNQQEADFLSQINLQRHQVNQTLFKGKGTALGVAPGYVMEIETSPDQPVLELLVTEVKHQASIENTNGNHLNEGSNDNTESQYQVEFSAIPVSTQYRPQLTIAKPVAMTSTGKIHSPLDNEFSSYRDRLGRYKVEFDYTEGADCSHWIRKTQQSAHKNQIDSPLLPGTEVQINYLNGNPDLPYISAAIDNSETFYNFEGKEGANTTAVNSSGTLAIDIGKSFHQTRSSPGILNQTAAANPVTLNDFTRLDEQGLEQTETLKQLEDRMKQNTDLEKSFALTYFEPGDFEEYNVVMGQMYRHDIGDLKRFYYGNQYREYHATDRDAKRNTIEEVHQFNQNILFEHAIDQTSDDRNSGLTTKYFGNRYQLHVGNRVNVYAGESDTAAPNGMTGQSKYINYGSRYTEYVPLGGTRSDSFTPPNNLEFDGNKVPSESDLVKRHQLDSYNIYQGYRGSVQEGNKFIRQLGDYKLRQDGNRTIDINAINYSSNIDISGCGDFTVSTGNVLNKTTITPMLNSKLLGSRAKTVALTDTVTYGLLKNTFIGGGETKFIGGGKLEIIGGIKKDFVLAPLIKARMAPEIKTTPLGMEDIKLELQHIHQRINNNIMDISSTKTKLESAHIKIAGWKFALIG